MAASGPATARARRARSTNQSGQESDADDESEAADNGLDVLGAEKDCEDNEAAKAETWRRKALAPLIKRLHGRNTSASILWANDHEELVRKEQTEAGIGGWRRTLARLWLEAPADEREWYQGQAEELKACLKDGDAWIECVTCEPDALLLLTTF